MDETYYDQIVPRTFKLERVEIDPKLLEPDPAEKRQVALAPSPVKLPEEKASFSELMATKQASPSAPKIDQPFLSEKPQAATTTLDETVRAAQNSGAESLLEDSQALRQALMEEKPVGGSVALVDPFAADAPASRALAEAGEAAGGTKPGFSNLDDLLAQVGPLSPETAPILMPTDLLFDYNKADLQAAAVESLSKLGTLMQRNPNARFIIEGHSDSFGPDDYNLALSTQRANSVKAWLISTIGIDPSRVETRGFGKTRLIAPASGSIEEQQINRRVEIVIKAPKQKDTPSATE
jgi:outer membrane protein OmpA-like peptidoglycan-associated protein